MKALVASAAIVAVILAGGVAQATPRAASGTIAGPLGDARLGSTVTFQTTDDNLKGYQYPMIDLECYQNGSIVFSQLARPDADFLLGGGSSQWLINGGPASCVAILDAYGQRGGQWEVVFLAETAPWDATG